jgi:hypothetical protein
MRCHEAIHCRIDALISIPVPCLFNLKYSSWLRSRCVLPAGISFGYNSRFVCTLVVTQQVSHSDSVMRVSRYSPYEAQKKRVQEEIMRKL